MNTATPSNHFKLTVSKASKPVLGPGRRETLTNRDLGTVEATAGRMLALVTSATQGMGPASGWHYHVCEHQLIYVLKGWVDLEAEDGPRVRDRQPAPPSWPVSLSCRVRPPLVEAAGCAARSRPRSRSLPRVHYFRRG
jgi:hypothetical protein